MQDRASPARPHWLNYLAALAAVVIGVAALSDLLPGRSWGIGAVGVALTVPYTAAAYLLMRRDPRVIRGAWLFGLLAAAYGARGWFSRDLPSAEALIVIGAGIVLLLAGLRLRWMQSQDVAAD